MRWRRARQAMPLILAAAGLLCGCYYDPNTGLTSAYPPPYGYPPPAPGVAPAYGEAPAAGYGGPEGYGEPAPQGYGGGAPPTYAAPPAYGPAPQGYGGAPAPAGWITRDQYIQRAMQRAAALNRDPQRAAQRAGAVFDQIDVNHSGVITQAQLRAWRQAHAHPGGGQQPPYEYQ
jgi:hypothetical protein